MAKKTKDKPPKNKPKGTKQKGKTQPVISERELLRGNQLDNVITKVEQQNEDEKKAEMQILYPLTKCNSEPIVHQEAICKSIFCDDSRSGDYGFEPNPEVPGTVVVLQDYPKTKLERLGDIPYDTPSGIFSKEIDDEEYDLLDKVEHSSTIDFVTRRVGKKNMDAIIGHLEKKVVIPDNKNSFTSLMCRKICFFIFLFILILVAAGGAAFYLMIFKKAKPMPPRNLPMADDSTFEYLPPGKSLANAAAVLYIPLRCSLKASSEENMKDIPMGGLFFLAFRGAGLELQNSFITSEQIFPNNTLVGNGVVFLNLYGTFPILLWYGVDYLDDAMPIERQMYIFIRDIIMVKMGNNKHPVNCNCTSNEINQNQALFTKQIGALFQEYVKQEAPQNADPRFKGYIGREYQRMVW